MLYKNIRILLGLCKLTQRHFLKILLKINKRNFILLKKQNKTIKIKTLQTQNNSKSWPMVHNNEAISYMPAKSTTINKLPVIYILK